MSAPTRPQALVDYLRLAADYLQKSGSASPRLDAELLLAHVLGMDRVALYVNFDRPLVPGEVDRYRELLRQRARGTPIAYILGSKPFLTTRVAVGPGVLIPRPETELLVEAAAARLREMPGEELLAADVGTGSGAIAIGLALLEPRARVAALDISADAVRTARANVERHGLENRIEVMEGDLLAPLAEPPRARRWAGRLDAVVSNPPYIATPELATLPRDIRDFEPRVALDGGPDGLTVYRRLIPQAAALLRPGGLLALEIGSDQGEALQRLLAADGRWRSVELRRDYAGQDRIVLAEKETTTAP